MLLLVDVKGTPAVSLGLADQRSVQGQKKEEKEEEEEEESQVTVATRLLTDELRV